MSPAQRANVVRIAAIALCAVISTELSADDVQEIVRLNEEQPEYSHVNDYMDANAEAYDLMLRSLKQLGLNPDLHSDVWIPICNDIVGAAQDAKFQAEAVK